MTPWFCDVAQWMYDCAPSTLGRCVSLIGRQGGRKIPSEDRERGERERTGQVGAK
jgi:hypothetical protein